MSWSVVGASVMGTAHRTRNIVCQDAMRYLVCGPDNSWLIVALADGAGSASHADAGANLVCERLIALCEISILHSDLSRDWAVELFTTVRVELVNEAEQLGVRVRELASTALLAVVGPNVAAFVQLGDGAIVYGNGADYHTVFWPEPAEYANATDFLSEEQFAQKLQFQLIFEPIPHLALFTDGLQRLALDFANQQPHLPFFRPLFGRVMSEANAEALAEPFRAFLECDAVNAKTDDDKTLFLAVRRA